MHRSALNLGLAFFLALIATTVAGVHPSAAQSLPAIPGAPAARGSGLAGLGGDGAKVRVAAEVSPARVAPGGRLVVAVVLRFARGWHAWTNEPPKFEDFDPIPTTLEVIETPEWIERVGAVQWPRAREVSAANPTGEGTIRVLSFAGEAVAFVPLVVSGSAEPGKRTVTLTLGYQACDDKLCEAPETVELPITVEIAPDASDAIATTGLFATFDPASFERAAPEPVSAGAVGASAPSRESVRFDIFGVGLSVSTADQLGVALVMLLAAVGGFLLNLTPCVLPMIPLKIMGLTQSAKNPGRAFLLGFVMCAGVVAFWLAIGAGIAFVSGFEDISALFQIWWFVVGVGVFIGAMALGMMGAFTFQPPRFVYLINPSQETMRGSFLFGLLTALLATPCVAPFLGSAVAWAVLQDSRVMTIGTFGAIGFGMALPYLVLAARPSWVSKVPRSGPASELIKQVMGLLMLAVAAFFIGSGVLALAAEAPYIWGVFHWWVASVFAGAAGLWLLVRTFQITRSLGARALGTVAAIVIAGGMIAWTVRWTQIEAHNYGSKLWVRYTHENFNAALARGDVVVIDFTAAWCLNCKALKATVLSLDEVEAILSQPGVTSLMADLTSRSDPGWEKLRELGFRGIPLLAVFGPGLKSPIVRDGGYTPSQVIGAIEEAKKPPGTGVQSTASH